MYIVYNTGKQIINIYGKIKLLICSVPQPLCALGRTKMAITFDLGLKKPFFYIGEYHISEDRYLFTFFIFFNVNQITSL